jgi:hypothetical protein
MFFSLLFSASDAKTYTGGLANIEKLSDLLQRVEPQLLKFQRLNPLLQLEHDGELWNSKRYTRAQLDEHFRQRKSHNCDLPENRSMLTAGKFLSEDSESAQYEKDLANLYHTTVPGLAIVIAAGVTALLFAARLCRRKATVDPRELLSELGVDEADSNGESQGL